MLAFSILMSKVEENKISKCKDIRRKNSRVSNGHSAVLCDALLEHAALTKLYSYAMGAVYHLSVFFVGDATDNVCDAVEAVGDDADVVFPHPGGQRGPAPYYQRYSTGKV